MKKWKIADASFKQKLKKHEAQILNTKVKWYKGWTEAKNALFFYKITMSHILYFTLMNTYKIRDKNTR